MPFSPSYILSPDVSLSHFKILQEVYLFSEEKWSSMCSALKLTRTLHANSKEPQKTALCLCTYTAPQILNWEGGFLLSGKAWEPKPSQCRNELELSFGWPQNQGWAKSSPVQPNKPEMLNSPISPEVEIMEDLQSF